MTEKIGSQLEALDVHNKALAIRRELLNLSVDDAESKLDASRSLIAVGVQAEATSDTDKALGGFPKCREMFRSLTEANPTIPQHRLNLANTDTSTADAFRVLGNLDEARLGYLGAIEIEEGLRTANPTITLSQNSLAATVEETWPGESRCRRSARSRRRLAACLGA